jgi:hypothetical protein
VLQQVFRFGFDVALRQWFGKLTMTMIVILSLSKDDRSTFLYSYGDSTGLTPDFPFNPGYYSGNQIRAKIGRLT